MELITGGAHASENNTTKGSAGDSKQKSVPDFDGEVSLRRYSDSSFNSRWKGYKLIRPSDSTLAAAMAKKMIEACNNANIGYSQGSREGVRTYGISTSTPTNCDCSSLVYQCLNECTGLNLMGTTATLEKDFINSGYFMDSIAFSSIALTTPYNGDVLVLAGKHTEIVVQGNPRSGSEDEIISSTASGSASQIYSYRLSQESKYSFEPRTTSPYDDDIQSSYYDNSNGFNSNGWYARSRFSEIMDSECDLSRNMVKKWYSYTEDMYSRGMAPSLGAVMCYTNIKDPISPGFASIVEYIHPDYLYVSQFSLNEPKFEYVKRTKKDGSWNLDLDGDGFAEYMFQGFIYNSAVSSRANNGRSFLEEFITNAESQVGKDSTLTKQYTNIKNNDAWSASFVIAIASLTGGLLNVIIPKVATCSAFISSGADRGMGTWLEGPLFGKYPVPQVGDIALFREKTVSAKNKYYADKAGIVTEVYGADTQVTANNKTIKSTFSAVIGDCENQVKKKKYTTQSNTFIGIYRPHWEKVDGIAESYKYVTSPLGLYTEGTGQEDAAIRDVSYAKRTSSGYQPSIQRTGITLCALNYTGMLANFYSVLAEVSTSNENDQGLVANFWNNTALSNFHLALADEVLGAVPQSASSLNLSGGGDTTVVAADGKSVIVSAINNGKTVTEKMTLTSDVRTIYQLLNSQLNNSAGTIGIMANMWQESRWNLATLSKDGGHGLVQWTDTTSKYGQSLLATELRQFCKTHGNKQDWTNNLSGQIEYLFQWVSSNKQYIEGMEKISNVLNSVDGAADAAYYFLHYMEIGKGYWGTAREEKESILRKGWARGVWTLFFGDK